MPKVKFFNKVTGKTEEREQTPEEIQLSEERKIKGQQAIQEQERLANKQGISSREAGRVIAQQRPLESLPTQTTVAEVTQRKEALAQEFQQQGVFEPIPTEPKQLVQPITTTEGKQQFINAFAKETKFTGAEAKLIETLGFEVPQGSVQESIPLTLKGISDAYKFQIKKGLLGLEIVSSKIGIPYVSKIIDAVSSRREEKIRNMIGEINIRDDWIKSIPVNFEKGALSRIEAFDNLNEFEKQMLQVESDVQQQAILSPSIRTEESLRKIQAEFTEQKRLIQIARRIMGVTIQQSPDIENLSLGLNELKAKSL